MVILGIDPGTAVTGYGVIRTDGPRQSLVECGVVRTRPRDDLPARLASIHEGITEVIARHRPEVLAIESVFYARNVRTTIALGHARGVAMLAAHQAGIMVQEFSPTEVKNSVAGSGAASKDQVALMVSRLLRLASPPQPSDAADGVAVALTCALSSHLLRIRAAVHAG